MNRADIPDKAIFSVGEVAKLCRVAPRTIEKWCGSGRLSSYHLPGTNTRRIPRKHLVAFLDEHAMFDAELTRLPQRFKYRKPGCREWDFGVCYPMGKRWRIQCGAGFSSFEEDPWEDLGQIIGDVTEFHWIDNDFGWKE